MELAREEVAIVCRMVKEAIPRVEGHRRTAHQVRQEEVALGCLEEARILGVLEVIFTLMP